MMLPVCTGDLFESSRGLSSLCYFFILFPVNYCPIDKSNNPSPPAICHSNENAAISKEQRPSHFPMDKIKSCPTFDVSKKTPQNLLCRLKSNCKIYFVLRCVLPAKSPL